MLRNIWQFVDQNTKVAMPVALCVTYIKTVMKVYAMNNSKF